MTEWDDAERVVPFLKGEDLLKLTDRLQHLADFVPPGSSMADIGTDHGKLPVFLLQQGICQRVILSDVGAGPLERAAFTIAQEKPPGSYTLRQGDGLSTLEQGEVDVVVIAGMGGALMASILDHDRKKTASFSRLILQPRNGKDKLRRYLLTHGMQILEEDLVREGKYFCEIIVAAPQNAEGARMDRKQALLTEPDVTLEVSPLLFQPPHPLLIPFLEKKIETEQEILEKIRHGQKKNGRSSASSSEQEQHCQQRIQRFQNLMKMAAEHK